MKWLVFLLFPTLLTANNLTTDLLNDIAYVLKEVESTNNPMAVGDDGASYGILQIQQCVLDDVNKHYGTSYLHEEMFIPKCAEEVFHLYIRMWYNIRKARGTILSEYDIVRIWNGGPRGHKKQDTFVYLKKYIRTKKKLLPWLST